MEDAIREIEKTDGLRMTWNVLPIVNTDDISLPIPLCALYTPRQRCDVLEYEPIFCLNCRSILNPYTTVNYDTKDWTCIFCNKKTHLPPHYSDISQESLPTEMINTTTEYLLSRESTFHPTFFFVVDMCTFDEQRYKLLIDGIKITFSGLPEESTVGLITYGTNVNLFDFQSEIKRTFIFSGERNYEKKTVEGFFGRERASQCQGFFFTKKTIDVNDFIKMIERDPFPVKSGQRPIRCTGSALSFATSLLESQFNDGAVKIFLFTEGPTTFGPGVMASMNLKENIRSGNDLLRGKAKLTKGSKLFFDTLAKRLANLGFSVDILSATLNDIGLYEMQGLVDMTGGLVVMAQDFDHEIFTTSCEKNVRSDENGVMEMVFNAKFKVQTKGMVYKHGLGLGSPLLNQKGEQIGWKLGSLHRNSNLGFVFESKPNAKENDVGYFQIITQYQRSDKKLITRVTTAARMFGNLSKFRQGFDQEAALILQARFFTFGTHLEEDLDLVRRIDRSLIRFIRRYGESSNFLKLPSSMALYPNLIYFLRRSLLVQSETNSPDETAYYRGIVARETVTNAMTMIHPTLIAFNYQEDTALVPMDAKSLKPDIILLLDTFHNVLIWRGEHIHQWVQEGYHEKEEYKFLKDCIDEAEEHARKLIGERLPTPQFTLTERYGSQERILLAKVNPSIKGQVVVTDDIDFATFYDCLCKIIKND